MSKIVWKSVQKEFAFDGSLMDILIFDTELADWQRALNVLQTNDFELTYSLDSSPTPVPADARQAMEDSTNFSAVLSGRFRGLLSNAFFHDAGEIMFDIDPREITGQRQVDALVWFMHCLADAVGREAVLAPEGCRSGAIFTVRPGELAVYNYPTG